MEGRHMAAGPWFTVNDSTTGWTDFGQVWLSDGASDEAATLQIKLTLEPHTMAEVALNAP